MRKRYSRSYTVLSFLTMFSYRELPFGCCFFIALRDQTHLYHKTIVLAYNSTRYSSGLGYLVQ